VRAVPANGAEPQTTALYVCYFGLREPLVQTQVLPYLRELHAGGVVFTLLTFEPASAAWSPKASGEAVTELAADGIEWKYLTYHKGLSGKVWDVVAGAFVAIRITRSRQARLLHARSHVAALMGAIARSATGARLLFDIRGFLAEEYVAGGNWREGGWLFRVTKRVERWLLAHSDGYVVLTRRAREYLFPDVTDGRDPAGRPVEVIPTCTDVAVFERAGEQRDAMRDQLGVAGRQVITYVGSLGTWYLTDELADLFSTAWKRQPRTFILCLTPNDPQMMIARMAARNVPLEQVTVRRAAPSEIPGYLAAADFAVSFSRDGFARMAASPTKLGEYLASGLPVIHSAGIGDVDECIVDNAVGALVRQYGSPGYLEALETIDRLRKEPGLPERCRAVARREFDLHAVAGVRYRRIYDRLVES
jgi:glycosyltransferase involved in cell wall biosynthesis